MGDLRRVARLVAALLGLGLLLAPVAAHAAQADCGELPDPTGYVVDQARVVDDAAERSVAARLSAFEASTDGRQVAVLVVDSIGDEGIEDYANDVFGCWGVGAEDADTGVLLVIAIEQRRLRIEVGRGLEGELTDVQAADIVRDVITPHLRGGDYTAGVRDGVEAIVRVLGGGEVGQPLAPQQQPSRGGGPSPLLLLGLLFGAFTLMSLVNGSGRRGARGAGGVFFPPVIIGGGGFGGGRGGGFGGGGFGGFGGGGSGGGGASGGW